MLDFNLFVALSEAVRRHRQPIVQRLGRPEKRKRRQPARNCLIYDNRKLNKYDLFASRVSNIDAAVFLVSARRKRKTSFSSPDRRRPLSLPRFRSARVLRPQGDEKGIIKLPPRAQTRKQSNWQASIVAARFSSPHFRPNSSNIHLHFTFAARSRSIHTAL